MLENLEKFAGRHIIHDDICDFYIIIFYAVK